MEIILGKINAASLLSHKGVSVAQFSTRLVELEARAAGQPYGRYPCMIERGREFIESSDAFSTLRKESVHRYVKNAGGLAQTNLRNRRVDCSGIGLFLRQEQKKAGRKFLPAFCVPGSDSAGFSVYVSCQTSLQRTLLVN